MPRLASHYVNRFFFLLLFFPSYGSREGGSFLEGEELLHEVAEVRCSESGGGVPSGLSLPGVSRAALGASAGDVVEGRLVVGPGLVECGGKETKCRLALCEPGVVGKAHHSSEDRARARGSANRETADAAGADLDISARRHVRVGTASGVEHAGWGKCRRLEELLNGVLLPVRACVGRAEPTAREPCHGRPNVAGLGSSNGGDVGKGGREVGNEESSLATASTVVSRGSEDGDTTCGSLLELKVATVHVDLGDGVLTLAVGDGEQVRHGRVVRHVREELGPGLLVVDGVLVLVGPHPCLNTVAHTEKVLSVQKCLSSVSLLSGSNLLGDGLSLLALQVVLQESGNVGVVVHLSDELGEGGGALARGGLDAFHVVGLADVLDEVAGGNGHVKVTLVGSLRGGEVDKSADEVDVGGHGGGEVVRELAGTDDAEVELGVGPQAELGLEELGCNLGGGGGLEHVLAAEEGNIVESCCDHLLLHNVHGLLRHGHPQGQILEGHVLAVVLASGGAHALTFSLSHSLWAVECFRATVNWRSDPVTSPLVHPAGERMVSWGTAKADVASRAAQTAGITRMMLFYLPG